MLVLTRKNGQKLMIGDNIEIVIIESYNNSVKIGIKAPKEVSVYREEVYNEVKKMNKNSHNASFSDIDKLQEILKEKKNETDTKLKSVTTKVKLHG